MTMNPSFPIGVPQSSTSSSSGTMVTSAPPPPGDPQNNEYTRTGYDDNKIPNTEDDLNEPVPGYSKLTKLMVKYPDFEAFQSYKDLNIKSLLYYQAELDILRKELHCLEWKDYRLGKATFEDAKRYCVNAELIILGKDSENENARRQYALIQSIRAVLKEYNAALLQYSQISSLPEADAFNVNSLHAWLTAPGKPPEELIQGPGANTWGDLTKPDPPGKRLRSRIWPFICSPFWSAEESKPDLGLIVPRAGIKVDSLARWVAREFIPVYDCVKQHAKHFKKRVMDIEKGKGQRIASDTIKPGAEPVTIEIYREGRILRFTSFITTIVACLLPTVAIAVLAQLHTTAQLLGLIAVFTAVFAGGLMLLVDSGTSRVEIFTATAAFSAVMVVFVQNQNPNGGTGSTSLSLNGTHI